MPRRTASRATTDPRVRRTPREPPWRGAATPERKPRRHPRAARTRPPCSDEARRSCSPKAARLVPAGTRFSGYPRVSRVGIRRAELSRFCQSRPSLARRLPGVWRVDETRRQSRFASLIDVRSAQNARHDPSPADRRHHGAPSHDPAPRVVRGVPEGTIHGVDQALAAFVQTGIFLNKWLHRGTIAPPVSNAPSPGLRRRRGPRPSMPCDLPVATGWPAIGSTWERWRASSE